jgi:hypothetical protein
VNRDLAVLRHILWAVDERLILANPGTKWPASGARAGRC